MNMVTKFTFHMSDFWQWYLVKLDHSPVLTKSLTSASLSMFSDSVAQKIRNSSKSIDIHSVALEGLFGLLYRYEQYTL
jgi:hypothetical protein